MKKYVDQKRREASYEVGDMAYLTIQPYRLKSLAAMANQKLIRRYYGPFEVLERIREVAYRL